MVYIRSSKFTVLVLISLIALLTLEIGLSGPEASESTSSLQSCNSFEEGTELEDIPCIVRNSQKKDTDATQALTSVFRENRGQMPTYIFYYAYIPDGMVGFGESKVYFVLGEQVFYLEFLGSNPVLPQEEHVLPSYSNYFLCYQSFTHIKHFSTIIYPDLYEGITLKYQVVPEGLKYEFHVEPYVDINQIRMVYQNVDNLQINSMQTIVTVSDYTLIDDSLMVWYAETGRKITCSFKNLSASSTKQSFQDSSHQIIQFDLAPDYDRSQNIIIDPFILSYSTFIGTNSKEGALEVELDDSNNVYITGYTFSSAFPTTSDAYDSTFGGNSDVFICKLSTDGSTLLYSTFIGGSNKDYPYAMVLDNLSNIYITGYTSSVDFPTKNAYDATYGGSASRDVFVCKLSADGSNLFYSTYLGGSDHDTAEAIVLDSDDNVYITGYTESHDFPTKNAYDYTHNGGVNDLDIFVSKLAANGTTLYFSTYIGTSDKDTAYAIALDNLNNSYITGYTFSSNFPTMNAYDNTYNGNEDVFVCKLAANGSTLHYSTYLGDTEQDSGRGIAVDSNNTAYIFGFTTSSSFPTINAYDNTYNGNTDVFISKLAANGSTLHYSTYFGGTGADYPRMIALDSNSNIYVSGETNSSDFPTENAYDASHNGNWDVFVSKLSTDGNTLDFSTFIGGSSSDYGLSFTLDDTNNLYVAGMTRSSNFPTVNAYSDTHSGDEDVFVCKFSVPDQDGDGLTDSLENSLGTNPLDNDTDADELSDGAEVNIYFTNPLSNDTDTDGLLDGIEVDIYLTNPLSNDTDADGLLDGDEMNLYSTNPLTNDTDGDTMPDGWEIHNGLNATRNDASEDPDSDGLLNLEEYGNGTKPQNNDTDTDGLLDGVEVNTYLTNPLSNDTDTDGLLDGTEVNLYSTNPATNDTDGDNMPDGWEIHNGLNATRNDAEEDPDADSLLNLGEWGNGTDPQNADTDADSLPDGWEVLNGLNATRNDASEDPDADGLSNFEEQGNGTDPQNADTDADSLPDGWEVLNGLNATRNDASEDPDADGLLNREEYGNSTNPQDNDTDTDGLPDGWEVTNGLNPLVDDTTGDLDGDGLSNLAEYGLGTNPQAVDTDGDGVNDDLDPHPLEQRPDDLIYGNPLPFLILVLVGAIFLAVSVPLILKKTKEIIEQEEKSA